jgi:hypothetical protein
MIELSRSFIEEIGVTAIVGVCAVIIFFVKRMFIGIENKLDRLEAQTAKLQHTVDDLQKTALAKDDFHREIYSIKELYNKHDTKFIQLEHEMKNLSVSFQTALKEHTLTHRHESVYSPHQPRE